jgi:putative FmdB family regulatory protein
MPTYDYDCSACGGFAAFRPMAARDEPAPCPTCRGESPRVFASAPQLALMEAGTRGAIETNERARHAPVHSKDYARLKHPAGCGCCSPGNNKRGATVTAANGNKAFPGKRPWMISH